MSDELTVISEPAIVPAPELEDTSIPKFLIKRNEHGLIYNGGIKYIYTPEGKIDWRKMINPKHLVPNKQAFERAKKEIPKSIEGLEDRELLILLAGIKELAQIRGFNSVRYFIESPSADYISMSCEINWIPNFETEGRSITFSAVGDASPFNTNSFGKNYLGPIAENRAFVRSVRNFLKINIVSQEEVAASSLSPEAETIDVSGDLLAQTMATNGVTWESLKKKLIEEKFDGAEELESLYKIPKYKQFELIERIKKKASAKKKQG